MMEWLPKLRQDKCCLRKILYFSEVQSHWGERPKPVAVRRWVPPLHKPLGQRRFVIPVHIILSTSLGLHMKPCYGSSHGTSPPLCVTPRHMPWTPDKLRHGRARETFHTLSIGSPMRCRMARPTGCSMGHALVYPWDVCRNCFPCHGNLPWMGRPNRTRRGFTIGCAIDS